MKRNALIFTGILLRIAGLLVIFQLNRLFYFLYNYHRHFAGMDFAAYTRVMRGGFRFDLTAILYLNALFIVISALSMYFTPGKWYRKILFFLFITTNALGYLADIADAFYFDFILKRTTSEAFMFAGEKNIGVLLLSFFKDYWYGFILLALFVYLTVLLYKKTENIALSAQGKEKNIVSAVATLLLIAYLSVIGVRSGFTWATRPININLAGAYVKHPAQMPLVLNTPFSIIRTWNKHIFKPVHYYPDEKLNTIYTPVHRYRDSLPFEPKNVVILILESFAREYTGLLDPQIKHGKGYTPFLDSLMLHSHTFVNAYANGRQSIDAMPSILASIPSLRQHYVLSPYITNKIRGLGNILKDEKSYYTAFIHGAPKGSMAFDAFTSLVGYDRYISGDEYPDRTQYDGHWGIFDEPFLQFTADKISEMPEPFAVTFFSLSSHHPFTLPAQYKNAFNKGDLPIHPTIQYTDMALRKFFNKIKKTDWYPHTLFVITADHCNLSEYKAYYSSPLARFAIPIIFFDPSKPEDTALDSTLTQQADIMPRILRRLHYSGTFTGFGNDPLSAHKPFNIQNINGTWQISTDQYILQFRNGKKIALFRHHLGFTDKKNILAQHPQTASEMEKQLKAFIQQYQNRLIYNRLIQE